MTCTTLLPTHSFSRQRFYIYYQNPKKYNIIWQKNTITILMKQLLWRYSILQFNNRREFDLRRGDFSEVLDLALTTHAVNLDKITT
jgi:hypothetical protein